MVQGLTAHYLTRSTWRLAPGESCLVHAAAGGVGLLLVQLARLAGATVIATAGGAAKTALAREAGAHATIDYTREDFPTEVRRLTSGRGVDVVYDSVGASTWAGSLDCLRPRGLMVSFGNASGPVPPTEPLVLSRKGSLFLTRPTLAHHIATQEELSARVGELVELVTTHQLRLRIGSVFPLEAAASAHAELSARRTTGKVLLRVSE
jgi:NADPH2:quinone reductase